ncbi:MAG: hypothetical protein ACJAQZ_002057 [Planctomycetota bacterium]|jgi:hypothetical protein
MMHAETVRATCSIAVVYVAVFAVLPAPFQLAASQLVEPQVAQSQLARCQLARSQQALSQLAQSHLAQSPVAQPQWQMQGGRMRGVAVKVTESGTKRSITAIEPGMQLSVAAGETSVHFPSNANGKPLSLQFETIKTSRVDVAVAPAAAAAERKLQPFGEKAYQGALVTKSREMPIQVHTIGAAGAELRNYRVSVVVDFNSKTDVVGIVTRHHEKRGCYLFSIDWKASKIRLERWLGTDHMIVRQVDAPWLSSRHTLTMQVDGFRLQCSVDDEIVLQSFDGALGGGAPGVAWVGERATIGDLMLEPVAAPLASAALVQDGNRAHLYAATPVAPGHLHVLELALDRPHPWVPRSLAGFEPYLDQSWAAPTVLWGDWRNLLGSNSIGEVGVDGTLTCELVLPDLPALRLHSVLARALLITSDGERIVGVTPSVRVAL